MQVSQPVSLPCSSVVVGTQMHGELSGEHCVLGVGQAFT